MTKANSWSEGQLRLFFLNTDFAGLGDAGGLRGSVTAGSVFLSAHESDPAATGDQTTGETAYTSYARVAVARDGTGFTVTAASGSLPPTANNAAVVSFPANTGSAVTITHIGAGTDTSGAGTLCYVAELTSPIVVLPSPFVMTFVPDELAWIER